VKRTALAAALAAAATAAPGCSSWGNADAGAAGADKVGLKVPLPDGWSATPAGEGALNLGPAGRPVLTVEHRPGGAVPTASAMAAAVAGEGAKVLGELAVGGGWLLRYQVAGLPQALLGARRLQSGVLLCASAPGATLDEVTQAASLCTDIGLGK
jgi:hypothetical protein